MRFIANLLLPAPAMMDGDLASPTTQRRRSSPPAELLAIAGVLAAATAALYGSFWLLDFFALGEWRGEGPQPPMGLVQLVFQFDLNTIPDALPGLSQVIVAVLGIAITGVSIIVQLAATRYSSRIADMFFRDRTNLAIMGVFVVAAINAVWVSLAFSSHFVLPITVAMTLATVTGSLLLLIPYFAHVFAFLNPERVILRIGQQLLDTVVGGGPGDRVAIPSQQLIATASMEYLADVAVNALAQKDKLIASHAVAALRAALVSYLAPKGDLPAAWFQLGSTLRKNPDLIALDPESISDLEEKRVWLEWKGMHHFWSIFLESLKHLPEMAHVVVIETRYVGEAAIATNDRAVTAIVLKFFNTHLMAALNHRDVRTTYSILYQYRQLAEDVIEQKRVDLDELTVEIGWYLKYYGQTAHAMGLHFVTETAAHALSALCERAFEQGGTAHEALLKTLLEVDEEVEPAVEEKALRGVRKAQVKLATYYLHRGAEKHARTIYADIIHESPARLASLHAELAQVSARDFWEITDRGINFSYLDAPRKEKLAEFFAWFQAS